MASEPIDGGINYYLRKGFDLKTVGELYPEEVSKWYAKPFLILDTNHASRIARTIAVQAARCFVSELRITHVPNGREFPKLFDE